MILHRIETYKDLFALVDNRVWYFTNKIHSYRRYKLSYHTNIIEK